MKYHKYITHYLPLQTQPLISHCLPVQTNHNNCRPTFSNFFGESKEIQSKLHSIILTLWQ